MLACQLSSGVLLWKAAAPAMTNFINVEGGAACSFNGNESRAYCPVGTKLMSGGHRLISFTSDMNSPDESHAEAWNNAWFIRGNGSGSCLVAVATCGY